MKNNSTHNVRIKDKLLKQEAAVKLLITASHIVLPDTIHPYPNEQNI